MRLKESRSREIHVFVLRWGALLAEILSVEASFFRHRHKHGNQLVGKNASNHGDHQGCNDFTLNLLHILEALNNGDTSN